MKYKNKILTVFLIVGSLLTLCPRTGAQTAVTNTPATNAPPSWYAPIASLGSDLLSASNLAVVPFGAVLTSGTKSGTVGGGALALYNVNHFLGVGVGAYYLGQWFEFNGDVSLQLPIHPLSSLGFTNFTVSPFVLGGIGTPLSGAGTDNGGFSTINQAGAAISVANLGSGWNLDIGGSYGTVTGAGDYSGNIAAGFIGLRRGF